MKYIPGVDKTDYKIKKEYTNIYSSVTIDDMVTKLFINEKGDCYVPQERTHIKKDKTGKKKCYKKGLDMSQVWGALKEDQY